jgi:hypothetical protein
MAPTGSPARMSECRSWVLMAWFAHKGLRAADPEKLARLLAEEARLA